VLSGRSGSQNFQCSATPALDFPICLLLCLPARPQQIGPLGSIPTDRTPTPAASDRLLLPRSPRIGPLRRGPLASASSDRSLGFPQLGPPRLGPPRLGSPRLEQMLRRPIGARLFFRSLMHHPRPCSAQPVLNARARPRSAALCSPAFDRLLRLTTRCTRRCVILALGYDRPSHLSCMPCLN